jgi:hypothetical protein
MTDKSLRVKFRIFNGDVAELVYFVDIRRFSPLDYVCEFVFHLLDNFPELLATLNFNVKNKVPVPDNAKEVD